MEIGSIQQNQIQQQTQVQQQVQEATMHPLDKPEVQHLAQMSESGNIMGFKLQTAPNSISMLNDSLEELSAMFEETETKSMGDRKVGEEKKRDVRFMAKVQFWTDKMPDMPNSTYLLKLMRQMKNNGNFGQDQLLRMLNEFSSDASHQFAALECLEEALKQSPDDAQLLQTLRDARATLVNQKGSEIQVGINLAEELKNNADNLEDMQGLRDLYRSEILGFKNPQECFRSLLAQGAGKMRESLSFLMRSCSIDMEAANPSTPPEALRRIILDLQAVEVLNTVMDKFEQLAQRMEKQFQNPLLLSGEEMTSKMLDMTQQTFINSSTMANFLAACGVAAKLIARMDFMRESISIFRALSQRLFEDPEARFRMIEAGQEYLDELIASENQGGDSLSTSDLLHL